MEYMFIVENIESILKNHLWSIKIRSVLMGIDSCHMWLHSLYTEQPYLVAPG